MINSLLSRFRLPLVLIFSFLMLFSFLVKADSMMFQANLERTGVYEDAGPVENPELVWKFDAGSAVISTPLVYEGLVYFVGFDGIVYAISQDNSEVEWKKDLEGPPSFQITLNKDVLLVGRRFSKENNERYLIAFNRLSGEERWRFSTDNTSGIESPTIYDGKIYLTSLSGHLYSLDLQSGDKIWQHSIVGSSRQPLIDEDVLYFQDDSQLIYALSLEDGEVQWNYTPQSSEESHLSTPVVDGCCIYALISHADGGSIVKINRDDGQEEALFPIESVSMSSVSFSDGIAFFGDDGEGHAGAHGYMNAMDTQTGELVWRFETGGFVRGAASIAGDTVYFGSHDHYMYAVDRHTGDLKWRYETGAGIASSPAVVDGRLYFGSIDGHVYVLE